MEPSITTPNAPLLRRTLAHIEANPQTWYQPRYRCGTGMCFAGWAVEMAGGTWASSADNEDEDPEMVFAEEGDAFVLEIGGRRVTTADARAKRVLGLDDGQAIDLFSGHNNLSTLREIVAELCESAVAVSGE